jgi:phosphomannomutase
MSIFKAYDIRGIVPTQLDDDLAYKLGCAAATLFKPRKIIVGTDVRESRDMLFSAFTSGLRDSGVDVLNIGTISTPILYFTTAVEKYDLGAIITASHNPKEYNGFKFCGPEGRPVASEDLQKLRKLVETGELNKAPKPGTLTTHDPLPTYRDHIYRYADFRGHYKIVIDTANAVCGSYLMDLYSDLDLEIVPLFFDVNSQFPNHAPDPLVAENLQDVKARVVETGAQLGMALDGDGDRVIFVDENGETVPGDLATILLAQGMKLQGHENFSVVMDCRSTKLAEEILEPQGIRVIRNRVGHTFIKGTMRRENALCGGELSGHYYFRDSFYTENTDLALFTILRMMEARNLPLSQLVKPLRKYYQSGEINFRVESVEDKLDQLRAHFAQAQQEEIDGLTIIYPQWWCNIRPSNTEPVLRLNLEADNEKLLQEKVALVRNLIAG